MKVTDLKKNEVIHCETEEQANAICRLMHEAGLTWMDENYDYLSNNYYNEYRNQTCYKPKTGQYCYIDYYKRNGYTIYKAEQFLNTKTMTKTRVLFEEVEEKKLKPIEFKSFLDDDLIVKSKNIASPREYDELILITRKYTNCLDVILAKDKREKEDTIYLGHWNDGIVE